MDTDKIAAFLWGLIIGFILGSICMEAAIYAFLTVKDWIRKRKEGNFTIGRNMKKGRPPKLMPLDED